MIAPTSAPAPEQRSEPRPRPTKIRRKPRPIGVPGTPLCRCHHPAPPRAPHNGATGLPRGARRILVLPATRQAVGAPSAWSQPPQSTHARPRRWCDAGSPGRQCVTAAQKAGVEGMVRNNGSDLTRVTTTRTAYRAPNDRSNGFDTSTTRLEARRKTAPLRGAGHGFVPEEPHGDGSRPAQGPCRAPSGSAMRSALPATRQAAGAPSAWSQPPQSTHARPRRWCDAGSPGRQCVTAAQKAGVEGMVRNNGSDLTRVRTRTRPRARNRHATVDSQDGCRYTIPNARGVAIGFQPVDDSDRIRDGR